MIIAIIKSILILFIFREIIDNEISKNLCIFVSVHKKLEKIQEQKRKESLIEKLKEQIKEDKNNIENLDTLQDYEIV